MRPRDGSGVGSTSNGVAPGNSDAEKEVQDQVLTILFLRYVPEPFVQAPSSPHAGIEKYCIDYLMMAAGDHLIQCCRSVGLCGEIPSSSTFSSLLKQVNMSSPAATPREDTATAISECHSQASRLERRVKQFTLADWFLAAKGGPLKCSFCNRLFTRNEHLKRHVRLRKYSLSYQFLSSSIGLLYLPCYRAIEPSRAHMVPR